MRRAGSYLQAFSTRSACRRSEDLCSCRIACVCVRRAANSTQPCGCKSVLPPHAITVQPAGSMSSMSWCSRQGQAPWSCSAAPCIQLMLTDCTSAHVVQVWQRCASETAAGAQHRWNSLCRDDLQQYVWQAIQQAACCSRPAPKATQQTSISLCPCRILQAENVDLVESQPHGTVSAADLWHLVQRSATLGTHARPSINSGPWRSTWDAGTSVAPGGARRQQMRAWH